MAKASTHLNTVGSDPAGFGLGEHAGAAAVAAWFIVYGAIHGLITRAAGPSLALDDAKLNVVTQSLQGGYMTENPPLFEWTLILAQQAVGPTLLSFIIVKYAFLTIAGVATYGAARIALGNRPWAALTAISLTAIYQIGWNFHQAFTHTTALTAAIALYWWALARVARSGESRDYVLLGLALGLGALAKYSFLPAAAIGLLAVALEPSMRSRALTWRMAIAIAVAAVMVWPHAAWVLTDNPDVVGKTSSRLAGAEASYIERIAEGAPSALWAVVSFALPIAPMAWIAFGRRRLTAAPLDHELPRIARRATLIGAAALIGVVFALGMERMQERYAIPFLFPLVFWLMAAARSAMADRIGALNRFLALSAAGLVAVAGLRAAAAIWPGPPFCEECRQFVPYEPLAAAIEARGLAAGTLVGFEDHTAGNLRRLLPRARVISGHMPYYTPPATPERRTVEADCLFIWSLDLGPRPIDRVVDAVDPSTSFTASATWRTASRNEAARIATWTIAPINHNERLTRELCRIRPPADK